MKFSVLIPVYNTEKYLEECLQSVLNQTYQDFEIVIVDDGSTDNSGLICDRYQEQYPDKIKVIHKENQGLISARRVGIASATGDYCIFVDSDDYIELDLLLTIVNYLNNSQIDVLIFALRYFRDGELIERKFKIATESRLWESSAKQSLYIMLATESTLSSLCVKVIKTNLLKNDPTDYTRFYDNNMSEDLLQSLYPITAANKIVYIDKVLYNYRMNESSVSHVFNPSKILEKSTLHVYDMVLGYLPQWGIDTPDIRERMNAKWLNETMYLFSEYYEKAKTKKERKDIINADWNQLLPYEVKNTSSKYENKNYRELYQWICEKRNFNINKYFWKKRIYKKFKRLKRKIK